MNMHRHATRIITAAVLVVAAAAATAQALTFTQTVNMHGHAITNVAPPVAANDAVIKAYVDGLMQRLNEMALIPAGYFAMGTTFADGGTGELPVHTNFISSFYLDKYEVTKAKWDEVRAWALANGYSIGVGAGKAANHPVQTVIWFDCVKWCNARSEMEGLTPCYYTNAAQTLVYRGGTVDVQNAWVKWAANGYRLPTEAEWEKAARGGAVGMRFPWADANTITNSRANYNGNTGYAYDLGPNGYNPLFAPTPYTSPVGYFAANGYGLYDMAGNVWEWCWDWYGNAYYASSPSSDPRGPLSGTSRVLRGGGWVNGADGCRGAERNSYSPGNPDGSLGFRCVRGL
ncbi:MAG: SUMF1/EgtB/PvdO family nonheme iron enzyme [bacterium]|nr:SUMF1/EgtB/PvdO family nonheme iron enzyme [bacterium]